MFASAGLRRLCLRLTYGLSRKLSLFVIALLTAFTGIFTTVNIVAEQQMVEDRLRQRARSLAAMLADFASNYLTDLRIDELRIIIQDVQRRPDVLYAFVLDPDDTLIVDGELGDENLFTVVDDPLSKEARARGEGVLVLKDDGLHAVEPVILDYEKLGTVRIGMSTDDMRRDLAAVRDRNIVLGLVFLACSLIFSLPLARRITRPLAELTASTEAVSRGHFDRRISINTNDELEILAAAFNRMLAQLHESMAQVRHLAYFDSVTELPNRVHFKQLLSQALANALRHRRRGAVLFLDLDRFKLINDTFGHDAGDQLLKAFAQRLRGCVRDADVIARLENGSPSSTVARLGGDEFTILLSEIASLEDPAYVAQRVLKALDQPFHVEGQTMVVGSSIGIAVYPDDGDEVEMLLKNADVAMYEAKEKGRNNYQFYSRGLSARAVERLVLERDLRAAVQNGELELHYQPQLDLATGEVVGFEALLRWRHPRLGMISPAKLIPLAEETRLALPIGSWVLNEACRTAREWYQSGLGPLRIAVNLSAVQFQQDDFVDEVAAALAASGLDPVLLELEITESMAMTDPEAIARRFTEVKRMGVKLAIDDFGTGYSSLSQLKRFPLDRLKIDKSFVHDVARDPDDEAIVTAIIVMAHTMRFEVCAEGVETEQQAAFLRRRGCALAQGYLFSPPLPAQDIAAWLLDWRRHRASRGFPAPAAARLPMIVG